MIPITYKPMKLNDCWAANRRLISMEWLIVHSTATPGVMAEDWYERWNKPDIGGEEKDRQVGVHAFLDDKMCMLYFPWYWRAWHIGTSWGNSHTIGVEWCEDKGWDEGYFNRIKARGIKLYAMLCIMTGKGPERIKSHAEAYKMGIGSNHADPHHWWKKFGYTMDMFREDVRKEIERMDVLKKGMINDAVRNLQEDLKKLGYTIDVDGSFGPATEAVVKRFQVDHNLVNAEGKADGIVWPSVQMRIVELLLPAPVVPEPAPEASWKCSIEIPGLTFDQAKALKVQYPGSVIIAE